MSRADPGSGFTQAETGDSGVETHFRSEVGEIHVAILSPCSGAIHEEAGGRLYFLLVDAEDAAAGVEPQHGIIATQVKSIDIGGGAKAESADGQRQAVKACTAMKAEQELARRAQVTTDAILRGPDAADKPVIIMEVFHVTSRAVPEGTEAVIGV